MLTRSTLGDIRRSLEPVFIKPVQEKLFTGFVWRSAHMGIRFGSRPRRTRREIWVSDRVNFVAEYRGFVRDQEIIVGAALQGRLVEGPEP